MNPVLFLAVGAVALLASGYVGTGLKLQKLSGYPHSFKYVKQAGFFANLLQQKFHLDLAIENPNGRAMTFQKFSGAVLFKGKQIATIYVEKRISLPAHDTTILKGIEVNVSTITAGTAVYNFLFKDDKAGQQMFLIKGTITADGFTYPVNEEIGSS